MVKVSKEEVAILREKAPQAHIAIVNRHSSHKKYYVEESKQVKQILRTLRGETDRSAPSRRQRHRGWNRRSGQ